MSYGFLQPSQEALDKMQHLREKRTDKLRRVFRFLEEADSETLENLSSILTHSIYAESPKQQMQWWLGNVSAFWQLRSGTTPVDEDPDAQMQELIEAAAREAMDKQDNDGSSEE